MSNVRRLIGHFPTVKICFQYIVAIVPLKTTKKLRFLKIFKVWVFRENRCFFFEKNLNLFKIAKCGIVSVESVAVDIISLKCLFHLNCEVLLAKNQNYLKLEKLENMTKNDRAF